MFKKLKTMLIILTFFSIYTLTPIHAYQFVNPDNENKVNDMITEIYDSKEQYEDLAGSYEEKTIEIYEVSSDSYWWPIGSEETVEYDGKVYAQGTPVETHITSNYGMRNNPFGEGKVFHSGVDISGPYGNGTVNVIAAKDGIVVYPSSSDNQNCPVSSSSSKCGGGYGNYVIIQHSDGNFTLYGHLHENTITVKAGESVQQGQVIGKMGSSGNSTGTHLHFEVREGSNSYSSTVDPLNYISLDEPRTLQSKDEFISWLNSWEGHTPIDGDYYTVVNIGDGVRTVGAGVTLENNPQLFKKYGMDINDYPVGSKIKISTVDQMKMEICDNKRSYVEGILSNNSITLKENEIQALVSMTYNTGNINGFVENYNKYGNTQEFYDNWFYRGIRSDFKTGLTRRRNAEWQLFHNGKYVYNG